jgi:hypothetical protein
MVKACTCPACGHPLPDIAVMLDLTHMQGRMFVALSDAGSRGIQGHDLLDKIYVGKPPRTGAKGLSVMKYRQKHGYTSARPFPADRRQGLESGVMKYHMSPVSLQKHGLKITNAIRLSLAQLGLAAGGDRCC